MSRTRNRRSTAAGSSAPVSHTERVTRPACQRNTTERPSTREPGSNFAVTGPSGDTSVQRPSGSRIARVTEPVLRVRHACQQRKKHPKAAPSPAGTPGYRPATASTTNPQATASTAVRRSARVRRGHSIVNAADPGDDTFQGRLSGGLAADKIPEDLRVLQFQKLCERSAFLG